MNTTIVYYLNVIYWQVIYFKSLYLEQVTLKYSEKLYLCLNNYHCKLNSKLNQIFHSLNIIEYNRGCQYIGVTLFLLQTYSPGKQMFTLFPEMCAIASACTDTEASKFKCAIYCISKIMVFSCFVLLLSYISSKEKYMLKLDVSFFAFTFIAMVHITWWYIMYCWHALYHTIQFVKRMFHWKLYTGHLKCN